MSGIWQTPSNLVRLHQNIWHQEPGYSSLKALSINHIALVQYTNMLSMLKDVRMDGIYLVSQLQNLYPSCVKRQITHSKCSNSSNLISKRIHNTHAQHWLYWKGRKQSKPRLRTLGRDPRGCINDIHTMFPWVLSYKYDDILSNMWWSQRKPVCRMKPSMKFVSDDNFSYQIRSFHLEW